MAEVTRSRRFYTDPTEVWAALADFGAIARWAPDVDHSSLLTAQTEGVGTIRRVQVGRATLTERITDWGPPATLAYEIGGLPAAVGSITNRWGVVPSDGTTLVMITTTVNAGVRPPQLVVAKAVVRRLGAASDSMLSGFERHLAGQADQAGSLHVVGERSS